MGDNTLDVRTDDLSAESTANKQAFAGDGAAAADAAKSMQETMGEEYLKGYLGDAFVEAAKADQKAYEAINASGQEHAQVGERAADGLDDAAQRSVAGLH